MHVETLAGRESRSLVDWKCYHFESRIVAEFRKRMREDLEKSRLGLALGLRREDWVERLWSLGIRDDNHTAIHLLPLAMVGWTKGAIERREAEVAMQGVSSLNPPLSQGAVELFQRWLRQKPDPWLWKVWEALTLAGSVHGPETQSPPLTWVAEWAERVAQASGGLLGIGKVSAAEQAILDKVQRYMEKA